MALLKILKVPDPRLKQKAKPVSEITDDIRKHLDDMLETMYADNGVGLAAIQVGLPHRLVVMDPRETEDTPPRPYKMVNPEIIWTSEDSKEEEEGCLSVPDHSGKVKRALKIKFKYLDETGVKHEMEAEGLMAACVQHEIDHLNGILFIDHLSPLKRNLILRRLLKEQRQSVNA